MPGRPLRVARQFWLNEAKFMQSVGRLENIGGGVFVEVSDEYGFGEDALLLAQFASPRPGENMCDLGTGCGIIPFLWCRSRPTPHIEAIEIQQAAVLMARRSVNRAGLQESIIIHHADLREWHKILTPGSQDTVTMNPPYFAPGTGHLSSSKAARISRHEGEGCTFEQAAAAAFGLLRSGGRFCVCHKPQRLCEILDVLQAFNLEPKRLRFIHNTIDSPPWLFLVESHKGGSKGLAVMPPFIHIGVDGMPITEQQV